MIVDYFKIKNWKIKIIYNCTCNDINYIISNLENLNCPLKYIEKAFDNISECKYNSGFTFSNKRLKKSLIIVTKTSSFEQLINTVSHEYYHLIVHIAEALNIQDEEELASLNGNLNMRTFSFLKSFIKLGLL